MTEIQMLQREIYTDYAEDLGLDPEAKYINGTPLKPVVPLDTKIGRLFILGAYPSARFALLNGISDVPVADNLGPFEGERWFDGGRVREQSSSKELQKLFFKPLDIKRNDCWITDLVKIFLFKDGHVRRYNDLNALAPKGYTRERFFDLGEKSLKWIEKEVDLAKPTFVITLGAEVAGILHGIKSAPAQTKLLTPNVINLEIGSLSIPAMHCAHPGILMRESEKNPWPDRHVKEFLPALMQAKEKFGF